MTEVCDQFLAFIKRAQSPPHCRARRRRRRRYGTPAGVRTDTAVVVLRNQVHVRVTADELRKAGVRCALSGFTHPAEDAGKAPSRREGRVALRQRAGWTRARSERRRSDGLCRRTIHRRPDAVTSAAYSPRSLCPLSSEDAIPVLRARRSFEIAPRQPHPSRRGPRHVMLQGAPFLRLRASPQGVVPRAELRLHSGTGQTGQAAQPESLMICEDNVPCGHDVVPFFYSAGTLFHNVPAHSEKSILPGSSRRIVIDISLSDSQ